MLDKWFLIAKITHLQGMIIGRSNEKNLLGSVIDPKTSSFIALYGRRRVGKTFLVRKFYEQLENEVDYFSITGNFKFTTRKEISLFNKEFKIKTGKSSGSKTWFDVFETLKGFVNQSSKKKVVLFFDEVPWLDKKNSDFLSCLSRFWDTFASIRENVILIISGSSGSWMNKMVFEDTGHMYNRVVHKLFIKPFSLRETGEYLSKIKGVNLKNKDILELYFYYGGAPYYLNKYNHTKRLEENISLLDDKFYKDEYSSLIDSIFGKKKGHEKIIKDLIRKKFQKRDVLLTGPFNKKTYLKALNDLIYSDFISKTKSVNDNLEDSFFIIDEFLQNYFERDLNPSLKGLRFEKIVFKHIGNILSFINENKNNVDILFNVCYKNVQVDLVIISKNTCYLFEIKHYDDKYSISKEYFKKIEKREEIIKEWLSDKRYSKREIIKGFITVNGLVDNEYSRKVKSIDIYDLFQK